MEGFSWFDLVTAGLILILAIKGVINGFIKEVFGLVGIVGGIFLASRFAQTAGTWIDANLFEFGNKSSLFLVGFLAVLIVFWLSCLFLGYVFSKLISMSGLGVVNMIGGFIVGGAKIFLVFSVLFVAVSNVGFIQDKLNSYLSKSIMYPIFIKAGTYIVNIKPKDIVIIGDEKDTNKTIIIEQNATVAKKVVEKLENNETNKTLKMEKQ